MRKLALSSIEGCRRTIALLLAIILLSSFAAVMIQTDGGNINISQVQFDARGGVQDADLYYPALTNGTSAPLPCVILSHGGGTTKDVMNTFAIELARRGFVVLNCSSYGAGLSDQPMYDEDGKGIEGMAVTSQGLYDAINYARTLSFVDETKIAVAGHSQGGMRVGNAILHDVPYLSLNDALINFMHETWALPFTAEEIALEADALADKYLNADQRVAYDLKAEELKAYYDTRVRAAVSIGIAAMGADKLVAPGTVTVAGHEVTRYLQTNAAFLVGTWDSSYPAVSGADFAQKYFLADSIDAETWYQVTDTQSTPLGKLGEISVADNEALRNAMNARDTRISITPRMTHSREFFSNEAASLLASYMTQALDYNNGPLTGENNALDVSNIVGRWKEYMNTIAMVAMIALAAVMVALMVKKPYFKETVAVHTEADMKPMKKPLTLAYWLANVVALFIACWMCNHRKPTIFNMSKFLPQDKTAAFIFIYVFFGALFLLAVLIVFSFLHKKDTGHYGLKKLGLGLGVKGILKSLQISAMVFVLCYASLAVISYLFGQDYRWWMCVFTEMKVYHWTQVLRYFVIMIPFNLVVSAATNYTVSDLKPKKAWLDTALTVVAGSAGVWLNHMVNMFGVHVMNVQLSEATICGGLIMFVPLSVYIARKTYRLTGSIWTGAFINSFLVGWTWVSGISITNTYMGATFLEKLLGF